MDNLDRIPYKNVDYEYDEKNKNYIILMSHEGLNHNDRSKAF